jgi:F-type H+-transporting ATPase subunit delta
MAELITVARPYAEAAFRAGLDAKDLPGFSGQLQLAAAVAGNAQMHALLANPKVSPKQKVEVFHSATSGRLGDAVKNLIDLLIDRHRTVLLKPISEHFDKLKREHESVLKVRIVSAFPMNDAEKSEMVQALAKKYGKTIEAEVVVDQSLIGGANIEIGDEVIHASVRDTLDKMSIALAN